VYKSFHFSVSFYLHEHSHLAVGTADSLPWKFTNDGNYSTSPAYKMQFKVPIATSAKKRFNQFHLGLKFCTKLKTRGRFI
jgi:hypothetical protein